MDDSICVTEMMDIVDIDAMMIIENRIENFILNFIAQKKYFIS